jgi:hypothetical protein
MAAKLESQTPPATAWAEVYHGRLPQGGLQWLVPQLLLLAHHGCKDFSKVHRDSELLPEYTPQALTTLGAGLNLRVRGIVKRASQSSFAIEFWLVRQAQNSGELSEQAGASITATLEVEQSSGAFPVNLSYRQFAWLGAGKDARSFVVSDMSFNFVMKKSETPKWLSQVSYEPGIGAAVKEHRFPAKRAYQLNSSQLPPLKRYPIYRSIHDNMSAFSEHEASSSRRRTIIVAGMAASLAALVYFLRNRPKPAKS